MDEHLSALSIEQYRRRTLSAAELLRADDHLEACENCRKLAAETIPTELILRTFDSKLREDLHAQHEHITYEQLEAFVNGRLDAADCEMAESHFDLCEMCKAEFEDLSTFRASLSQESQAKTQTSVTPSLAERLAGFARVFSFPRPVGVAAALALLFVVLTGLLWWRQTRPAPEVAQTPLPPRTEDPARPSHGSSSAANTPDESRQLTNDTAPVANNESSPIVVELEDGGTRITLDAQGQVRGLESLSSDAQQAVKNALASGRVYKPNSLAGLNARGGTLMGGSGKDGTFSLSSPVAKIVRIDRPTFTWQPLPGAAGYTVTLLDSELKIVATSPSLSVTTWVPPRTLERGRIYTWQVSALKDGQKIISPAAPAPQARFKILEKAKDDELKHAERTAARSHLALGILYARAGLLDEAERELRALVAANPQSTVARNLLRSVRGTRRRLN